MIEVKVYDSDFHPYKALSAFTDPRSASIEVKIEPREEKARVKPTLEELTTYALGMLIEDNIVSDSVLIGYAKARLYSCLSAVLCKCAIETANDTINNADTETRTE